MHARPRNHTRNWRHHGGEPSHHNAFLPRGVSGLLNHRCAAFVKLLNLFCFLLFLGKGAPVPAGPAAAPPGAAPPPRHSAAPCAARGARPPHPPRPPPAMHTCDAYMHQADIGQERAMLQRKVQPAAGACRPCFLTTPSMRVQLSTQDRHCNFQLHKLQSSTLNDNTDCSWLIAHWEAAQCRPTPVSPRLQAHSTKKGMWSRPPATREVIGAGGAPQATARRAPA